MECRARIRVLLLILGAALAGVANAQAQPTVATFRGSDVVALARAIYTYGEQQQQLYHAYDVPLADGEHVAGLSVTNTFELLARTLAGWRATGTCPEQIQIPLREVRGPSPYPALEPARPGLKQAVTINDLTVQILSALPLLSTTPQLPARFLYMGAPGAQYHLTTAQFIMAMAFMLHTASQIGKPPEALLIPLVRSPQTWGSRDNPMPVSAPAVPALASPLNAAVDLVSPVTLAWNTNTDSVMVQVARDPRFQEIEAAPKVQGGSSVELPLPGGVQYWWRVQGFANGQGTGWSQPWTFSVKLPEIVLPRFGGVSAPPPWTARPETHQTPMFVEPLQAAPRTVRLHTETPERPAARDVEPPSVARIEGVIPPRPKSPALPGPPKRPLPQARLVANTALPIPPKSPADAAQPARAEAYIMRLPRPDPRPDSGTTTAPDTPPMLGAGDDPRRASADIQLYANGVDLTDPDTGDALDAPLCGIVRIELTGTGAFREATITVGATVRQRFLTAGPHVWLLDTARLRDDAHTLTAVVMDTLGRTRTYSFTFVVRNGRNGTGLSRPDPAEG